MAKLPTDLQILEAVYDRYYKVFGEYSDENPNRSSKLYVPIDLTVVARDLHMDAEILFGRLYYHLDAKHRYEMNEGGSVHLFAIRVGQDHHCIHFPFLTSVLADLKDKQRKYLLATTLAIISLVVSVTSFLISLFG